MSPRAAIEAFHLRRLRALLAAILPANRFWRRKLGRRPPQGRTLGELLDRIPFTTKGELTADQAAHTSRSARASQRGI